MEVISVINYKGGVGKTTLTANIAGELAYRGYDVLMIADFGDDHPGISAITTHLS